VIIYSLKFKIAKALVGVQQKIDLRNSQKKKLGFLVLVVTI